MTAINNEKYIDELASSVAFLLNVKRGSFYPNKNFGSYLSSKVIEPKCEYALAFARQAVDGIDGVYIKSVKQNIDGFVFKVIINDYEREVAIKYDNFVQ